MVEEDYTKAFTFELRFKIKARIFRLYPLLWITFPCMSVELYGYKGEYNIYCFM